MLVNVRFWLHDEQKMVLAGCFSGTSENTAWIIQANSIVPQPCPHFTSMADEADLRIWRHARQCTANNILIYSPSDNIYNIGLGSIDKNYIIQLNSINATEESYMHLNNLSSALLRDPDLASLPQEKIGTILMLLFISTGCDSVSCFKTIGKASFFNSFFKQSNFIYSTDTVGSLHQVQIHERVEGFLCFLRMVGTVYFYKHLASFNALYGHETPTHLYNSIDPTLSPQEKHKKWIEAITSVVANHIKTEEERLPSYTALWRHWLRSCWMASLWLNASLPNPRSSLPFPENSGWLLSSERRKYTIDWEDPDIVAKVETNIALLIKGCKCKGGCKTNRCGCKKKLVSCGPGCECHECTNLSTTTISDITKTTMTLDTTETITTNTSTEDSSDDSDSEDEIEYDETDDGMTGSDDGMTGSDDNDYIETELFTDQFTYCVDIF